MEQKIESKLSERSPSQTAIRTEVCAADLKISAEIEPLKETLERFLNMPISSADGIFEIFSTLPEAIIGKGSGPLERYVYIPGKRTDRIVLVAHGDTVWDQAYEKKAQTKVLFENGIYRSANPECGIGADDRAGCAMLWALKDSGHSLLIVDGEERGKFGARYLRATDRKLYRELNRHRFMMEFDWTQVGHCLYSQVENSKAFQKYICDTLDCTDDKKNCGCDLQILCKRICGVNVGIGYRRFHRPEESIALADWYAAYLKISEFLAASHPCFKIPMTKRFKTFLRRCRIGIGRLVKKLR